MIRSISTMIKNDEELDEHYRMLESDLESLFKLIVTHRKPVSEGDIRLASVILRKWLIDGQLGRLCNAAGVKASFFTAENSQVCAALLKTPEVDYYLTGGLRMNGVIVQNIYNANVPPPKVPLLPVDTVGEIEVSFREFMKQKRLYFEGTFFSCEDIIKFTANKLGGAHLDFDRPGAFAQLNRAATYMMYGGPEKPVRHAGPTHLYMVLEPASTEILSGLHLEIIAASASLLHVRLGGQPVMLFEVRRSLWSRIRRRLWPSNGFKSAVIGYGPDERFHQRDFSP